MGLDGDLYIVEARDGEEGMKGRRMDTHQLIRINKMRVLDVVFERQRVGVLESQELDPWLQPERPELLDLFGGVEGLVMVLVIVSSRPPKWNRPAATEESATYPLARLHQPHNARVKVRARLPRRGFLVAA